MRRRKGIEQRLDRGRVIRLCDAYSTQADDSRAIALASRHESRLNRIYQSCYKVLRLLQAERMKESTQPPPPQRQRAGETAATQPANQSTAKPDTRQPAEKICDNEPSGPVVSGASDADTDVGGILQRNKVDYNVGGPLRFA